LANFIRVPFKIPFSESVPGEVNPEPRAKVSRVVTWP